MRGNPQTAAQVQAALRSIPAYAGEPRNAATGTDRSAVYPRVCGGTGCQLGMPEGCQGLSPRMRGNLNRISHHLHLLGSIPAYAGEPPQQPRPRRPVAVYPRVCGGTRAGDRMAVSSGGLSPRMRGNPCGAV